MKPVLFHDFLVRMGGAEHVLFTFSTIFPEAPIYTFFYDEEKVEHTYPGLSKRIIPHPVGQRLYDIFKRIPFLSLYTTKLFVRIFPHLVEQIDLHSYDFILANSTAWAHGLVPPSDAKFIVYMNSPMRFVWDWFNEYKYELGAKKHTHWKNIVLTWLLSKVRIWDQIALKKESILLCNSKTIQKRIEKFYKRTDAILLYPPVDVRDIPMPQAHAEHDGYFIVISTLTKYKRIDIVIDLFNKIGKPLLIVGDGPYGEYLRLRSEKNITFAGYVSKVKKFELLSKARALIFPTEDDFGIVPIEALAAGKPVIALRKGGAREYVVPGVTGEFFEEQNSQSLEKAIAQFLSREEEFDPKVLRMKAETFSTEAFLKNFKSIMKTQLHIDLSSKNF